MQILHGARGGGIPDLDFLAHPEQAAIVQSTFDYLSAAHADGENRDLDSDGLQASECEYDSAGGFILLTENELENSVEDFLEEGIGIVYWESPAVRILTKLGSRWMVMGIQGV